MVQTIPSAAYNLEKTLAHARLYAHEFNRIGVPRDRFAIKIISTGQGVSAARILQNEGISTLGTGVFGLNQAVACSQAGCLFISPYYNGLLTSPEPCTAVSNDFAEVRSILDRSLWPNVADPTTQHPFSRTLAQMSGIYEHLQKATGKKQPLIKLAAYVKHPRCLNLVILFTPILTLSVLADSVPSKRWMRPQGWGAIHRQ